MLKKKFGGRQIAQLAILIGVTIAILLLVVAVMRAATTNTWPNFGAAAPTPDYCSDVSAVECVYRRYGKEELYQSDHGREFKTSLTAPNGFVITLERAYVDANLVLISYTYHSPAGRNYFPYEVHLKDASGRELKQENSDISPQIAGQFAWLSLYDASGLVPEGNPAEVKLRLEIPSISGDYETTPPTTGNSPVKPASQPNFFDGAFIATPAPIAPTPISTNLSFDFKVPFVVGRESYPKLEVKGGDNGTPVTLEQVVVSPTQIRFKVKGSGSSPIELLTFDGSSATHEAFPRWSDAATADGYQTISYDTGVAWQKSGGIATLTLKPNPNRGMVESLSHATVVPGGPWIIRFTIP